MLKRVEMPILRLTLHSQIRDYSWLLLKLETGDSGDNFWEQA